MVDVNGSQKPVVRWGYRELLLTSLSKIRCYSILLKKTYHASVDAR